MKSNSWVRVLGLAVMTWGGVGHAEDFVWVETLAGSTVQLSQIPRAELARYRIFQWKAAFFNAGDEGHVLPPWGVAIDSSPENVETQVARYQYLELEENRLQGRPTGAPTYMNYVGPIAVLHESYLSPVLQDTEAQMDELDVYLRAGEGSPRHPPLQAHAEFVDTYALAARKLNKLRFINADSWSNDMVEAQPWFQQIEEHIDELEDIRDDLPRGAPLPDMLFEAGPARLRVEVPNPRQKIPAPKVPKLKSPVSSAQPKVSAKPEAKPKPKVEPKLDPAPTEVKPYTPPQVKAPNPPLQMSSDGLPFARRLPKPNMVASPFLEGDRAIDITGMVRGQTAKCPYTGKLFKVP